MNVKISINKNCVHRCLNSLNRVLENMWVMGCVRDSRFLTENQRFYEKIITKIDKFHNFKVLSSVQNW